MFTRQTATQITLPFQGRWVRKVFVSGLGLPRRWVYSVLRGLKTLCLGGEVQRRRAIAQAVSAKHPISPEWHAAGHRPLTARELGDARPVLEQCRALNNAYAAQADARLAQTKAFLIYTLRDQDFIDHPDIVRFVLSPAILESVTQYLGTAPLLSGLSLLWSPPLPAGTPPTSSQRFHNDHEDLSQIKLFVHVDDVTPEHGLFHFHSAPVTERVRNKLGTSRGRLDDEEVAQAANGSQPLTLMGPAGTAHMVDTSRCLHFGSRPSTKGRLILQAQYLRCNSPAHSSLALRLEDGALPGDWLPLQRMALGLR